MSDIEESHVVDIQKTFLWQTCLRQYSWHSPPNTTTIEISIWAAFSTEFGIYILSPFDQINRTKIKGSPWLPLPQKQSRINEMKFCLNLEVKSIQAEGNKSNENKKQQQQHEIHFAKYKWITSNSSSILNCSNFSLFVLHYVLSQKFKSWKIFKSEKAKAQRVCICLKWIINEFSLVFFTEKV